MAAPSAAAGWRIADVVAHIEATARGFYTPSEISQALAPSLERFNEDQLVTKRRPAISVPLDYLAEERAARSRQHQK